MASTLKYKITGINGIFRIPIEQNDNVNAVVYINGVIF